MLTATHVLRLQMHACRKRFSIPKRGVPGSIVASAAWRLNDYTWKPAVRLGFELSHGNQVVQMNTIATRRKFYFSETLGLEVSHTAACLAPLLHAWHHCMADCAAGEGILMQLLCSGTAWCCHLDGDAQASHRVMPMPASAGWCIAM